MIRLGVSVYPEQESVEDIEAYLKLASSYGFSKVFTSLFSVEGTKEEIIHYFKTFSQIAHRYNMEVSGDANTGFFEKVGATVDDLSVFKEMGIDTIRMDFCYKDERDVQLINNQENIRIEMSAAFVNDIDRAILAGADVKNLSACHNFYPERYSGPALKPIYDTNEHLKEFGVRVGIFISSTQKGTHGPWPVSDGLPTLEDHRDLPIELQLKHCLAMKNVDEILIGNAFASEAEFKAIAKVMEQVYVNIPKNEKLGSFADLLPHGDVERFVFNIETEPEISELEKEILFNYPTHSDLGDGMYYMLRSRWTRIFYRNQSIPCRPCNKTHYTRGDVVIVNDNLAHYRGEIEIVLKDMKVDGQRNLLGRIDEREIMLLDYVEANDLFAFIQKS